MGKIWVEVCLISARGLQHSSSLWKLQWFAVGWIDPNNKYCTKIDASGNGNPVWKTKFSISVDSSEANFKDKALHVEVYSREPIFLRERLLGTATIILKEFLDKYLKNSEVLKPIEEVGSFQLRKKNSNKPQGFVDLSIRISEEREEPSSHKGNHEEVMVIDGNNGINLDNEYGPQRANIKLPLAPRQQPEIHPQAASSYSHPMDNGYEPQRANIKLPLAPRRQPEIHPQAASSYSHPMDNDYEPQRANIKLPLAPRRQPEIHPQAASSYGSHTMPFPKDYLNLPTSGPSYASAAGPSHGQGGGTRYQPPRTPPPPPPPLNVGYIPTLMPRADNFQPSYMTMPSSGPAHRPGAGPGFGMGVGAGALAAGAMIFGDDFMSGFDVPRGLQDPSLIISTDLPF